MAADYPDPGMMAKTKCKRQINTEPQRTQRKTKSNAFTGKNESGAI
jgi:hypothetical protein